MLLEFRLVLFGSIEEAVILCEKNKIDSEYLQSGRIKKTGSDNEDLNLEKLEKEAIEKALKKATGNVSKAAQYLGITRFALYRKMEKFEL